MHMLSSAYFIFISLSGIETQEFWRENQPFDAFVWYVYA